MAIPEAFKSPHPRIEVTQELIEQAIPRTSGHCAIADAVSAAIPQAVDVTVDLQCIRWTDRGKGIRYVYFTPPRAQRYLLSFDEGAPVEPWTFRLPSAIQIVPVRARSKATKQSSIERRAELEAKESAGEELTTSEQRSLRTFRAAQKKANGRTAADKPTSDGPTTNHFMNDAAHTVVKSGGRTPPRGALVHGRGRHRLYGIRSAGDPTPI
jgi:hypothetical protein